MSDFTIAIDVTGSPSLVLSQTALTDAEMIHDHRRGNSKEHVSDGLGSEAYTL